MSLQLNQRIKTLSDQLTDNIGSELSSFANEISSEIGNISNSLSNTTASVTANWADRVSESTYSIANSIIGYLSSVSDSANTITSAAGAVTALKSSADAYVEAYNEYKSSIYYRDTPPEDCKNEAAWWSEKKAKETNVKNKEADAEAKEAAVKACFNAGGESSSSIGSNYEVTTLTERELRQFCRKYDIKSNSIVKKTQVNINGAVYDLYYVYDPSKSSTNSEFEEFVDKSIKELEKIDANSLELVSNTSLIFQQSYDTDNGIFKDESWKAVYRSDKQSIQSIFQDTEAENQFTITAILHEYGHAVDNNVSKAEGGNRDSFISEDKEGKKWKQLAKKEGYSLRQVDDMISGISGYTVNDYIRTPSEYLADCFYAYHSSASNREILRRYCPETYKEIEQLSIRAKIHGGAKA